MIYCYKQDGTIYIHDINIIYAYRIQDFYMIYTYVIYMIHDL